MTSLNTLVVSVSVDSSHMRVIWVQVGDLKEAGNNRRQGEWSRQTAAVQRGVGFYSRLQWRFPFLYMLRGAVKCPRQATRLMVVFGRPGPLTLRQAGKQEVLFSVGNVPDDSGLAYELCCLSRETCAGEILVINTSLGSNDSFQLEALMVDWVNINHHIHRTVVHVHSKDTE